MLKMCHEWKFGCAGISPPVCGKMPGEYVQVSLLIREDKKHMDTGQLTPKHHLYGLLTCLLRLMVG